MTPYLVLYSQPASWIRHLGFFYKITEKKIRIHLNLGRALGVSPWGLPNKLRELLGRGRGGSLSRAILLGS